MPVKSTKGKMGEFLESQSMSGPSFIDKAYHDCLYKPKEKDERNPRGVNVVRFLPTHESCEGDVFGLKYSRYWVQGLGPAVSPLCMDPSASDPVLDMYKHAKQAGNQKLIQALKPQFRFLLWVLEVENNKIVGDKPLLWDAPQTSVINMFQSAKSNFSDEIVDLHSPDEGMPFSFTYGKDGGASFPSYDNYECGTKALAVPDAILEKIVPLQDVIKIKTTEELEAYAQEACSVPANDESPIPNIPEDEESQEENMESDVKAKLKRIEESA